MTPNEFVIWLKGFSEAANDFTLTPKQWDDLKEKLSKVVPDNYIKGTRYNLDNTNNTTNSWTISNSKNGESNTTYGRPGDLITYTN